MFADVQSANIACVCIEAQTSNLKSFRLQITGKNENGDYSSKGSARFPNTPETSYPTELDIKANIL
jgi:hypothetical protein